MTDDLTALLLASRPPVDEAALCEASVELARETVRTSRVVRARRRRRLVGVVASVAVAVPATAAATYWTAHTGEHGDSSLSEENASEWLDVCAPDFAKVAAGLAPTSLALPAGVSWATATDRVVGGWTSGCDQGSSRTQADGVRLSYESYAGCAWGVAWLRAEDRGDQAVQTDAVAGLRRQATSPVVADNDGGGVVASLTRVADAAAAGDAGPVRDQVAANCTSAWFEGVR